MKKVLFILLVSGFFVLSGCGNNSAEYKENALELADKILSNSAEVETILNGYANIWKFSIESGTAISVEDTSAATGLSVQDIQEHFSLNSIGNVPGDFSTNVNSLKLYYQSTGELTKIEEASEEIKNAIKELNDPPSDQEKLYDELLNLYNISDEYARLASSPSGSLQSFNDDKSNLSSEILNIYNKIEVISPKD